MIINKTPHDVNIVKENEVIKTIPKSDSQIRLSVQIAQAEPIDEIKTSFTVFGEPEGLPEYEEGVFYIVSQLVKSALPGREDLLVPAEVVRDEKGQIIGCKSLGR